MKRWIKFTIPIAVAIVAGALVAIHIASSPSSPPSPTRPAPPTRPVVPKASGAPTAAKCERRTHRACYSPAQIQHAYDLDPVYERNIDGHGVTIAIVVSFGSPSIRDDLDHFDRTFGLPPPPSLRIIQPAGPVPAYDRTAPYRPGWAVETSLDVGLAHAPAP